MSVHTAKLKILKGSTTYSCDLYTTKAEAGTKALPIKTGTTSLWAALISPTATGATPGRVLIGSTTYAIGTKSLFTLTITQSANQQITVTANGQTYTSSVTLPYGTAWTATIKATTTGYNPGTLSKTSGTLTANTTISATAATLKTYTVTITQPANGSISAVYNGTTYTSSFTAQHGKTVTFTCTPNSGYAFSTFTQT